MFPDMKTHTITAEFYFFQTLLKTKLCMITTYFGGYQFIPDLMTMTVSRSQVCWKQTQKGFVLIPVQTSLDIVWLLHASKRTCTKWFA